MLYHEDGSVKGVATVDQGIAKDGSPKVRDAVVCPTSTPTLSPSTSFYPVPPDVCTPPVHLFSYSDDQSTKSFKTMLHNTLLL